MPAIQVAARTTRRTFTADYKLRILHQAERCKQSGTLGILLQKEGLYASHLASWRAQAASVMLNALAPKRRGPAKDLNAGHIRALAEKDRVIAEWKRRALRAEAMVQLQRARLVATKRLGVNRTELQLTSLTQTAAKEYGVSSTCAALGIARSKYYREHASKQGPKQKRTSVRRLSDAERQMVWDILHEARFIGLAPAVIHAQLLNEGRQLCSVRTMHRILAERDTSKNG
jgi:transposase